MHCGGGVTTHIASRGCEPGEPELDLWRFARFAAGLDGWPDIVVEGLALLGRVQDDAPARRKLNPVARKCAEVGSGNVRFAYVDAHPATVRQVELQQ